MEARIYAGLLMTNPVHLLFRRKQEVIQLSQQRPDPPLMRRCSLFCCHRRNIQHLWIQNRTFRGDLLLRRLSKDKFTDLSFLTNPVLYNPMICHLLYFSITASALFPDSSPTAFNHSPTIVFFGALQSFLSSGVGS